MRKSKMIQTLCATLLSGSMAIAMMPLPAMAQETSEDSHPTEKTETVYAFVDGDGKINKTIVSAWLHDDDGIQGIQEDLNLSDVKNVKGDEEPQISGTTYTWSVNGPDVYYQGNSAQTPPMTLSISYKLDGKDVKAADLAGKSGHLQTTVHFNNNKAKTVDVNGRQVVLHPTFMAGGMMDLDNNVFSNVHCEQGKTINDGDKEFLLFAALPGMKQTLETAGLSELVEKTEMTDDIVIEADVKDFELPALYVAASNEFELREIGELDKMSDLTGKVQELFDGADQIRDGADQLADGMNQLKTGIAPLGEAGPKMALMADGIVRLDDGAGTLAKGVRDYTYGVKQLNDGNAQLYQVSGGIDQMRQAINAKNSLKDSAAQLSAGLDQLNAQVSGIDASQLEGLKGQLDQAMQALQQLSSLLDKDLQTLNGMKRQMDQVTAQASALAGSIQSAAQNIGASVQSDAQKIAVNNQKIAALNSSISASKQSASASMAKAQSELQTLKAANPDLDTAALEAALNNAAAGVSGIAEGTELEQLSGMNPADLQTLSTSLQSLQQLSGALDQSMEALTGLKSDLDTSVNTLTQLKTQLDQVSSSDQFTQLITKLETLKTATAQLAQGGKSLSEGINTLDANLQVLSEKSTAAFDQLNAGSQKLEDNSQALVQGAEAIKAGTAQMNASTSQLGQLQSGIASLTSAVDQLADGANQLKEGANTFDEQGMGKLKEVLGWSETEMEAFKTICNESADFNETVSIFSGAPEGAKTKVRYIFKTEEK